MEKMIKLKINRNKCIATSNKCLTSSNKKLLGTSASLLVTGALLVEDRLMTMFSACPHHIRAPSRPKPSKLLSRMATSGAHWKFDIRSKTDSFSKHGQELLLWKIG